MGKQSGLGQRLYVGGYDISGDITELGTVASPIATLDTTGIDKSAMERIQGLKDGQLDVTAWFNPENVSTIQEHAVYSTLPRTDVLMSFVASPVAIGAETYNLIGKQINYDPKRAQDGTFTFGVSTQGNGYGGNWGKLLTAGKRSDTVATLGTANDGGAASAFGFQAYLQIFAFAGTDVTVKLQDSADNVTFADITSGTFVQITSTTPGTQRIAVGGTAAVRRYVRATTVTSAGFTSLVFAVVLERNLSAIAF